jgi:hypothetical protein
MGWVVPIKLKKRDQIIWSCNESEETWLDPQNIGPGSFAEVPSKGQYSYLNFVMEHYGLSGTAYDQLEHLAFRYPVRAAK